MFKICCFLLSVRIPCTWSDFHAFLAWNSDRLGQISIPLHGNPIALFLLDEAVFNVGKYTFWKKKKQALCIACLDRKPKISKMVGTVYQGSKLLRSRGCHPDIEGRGLAVSRRWPHSAIQHWYGTTSDPLPPITLKYFYNIYMMSHTTFFVS